jgi:predicted NBD/HSP70 family sugar kinase
MQIPLDPSLDGWPLACVEIGGGSIQTVLFEGDHTALLEGAHQPDGFALAFAVPGVIADGVVRLASNLGWKDTDPVKALGLEGPASLVINDAEAAALGEAALRGADGLSRLTYMCIGTGVGGAVIADGNVVRSNLFGHDHPGHGTRHSDTRCRCERIGCLETVAAGWALPDPLSESDVRSVADHLADAIESHELAADGLVVLAGGIARRYPALAARVAARLPRHDIEPSCAPDEAKSAAAWGLQYALVGKVEAVR